MSDTTAAAGAAPNGAPAAPDRVEQLTALAEAHGKVGELPKWIRSGKSAAAITAELLASYAAADRATVVRVGDVNTSGAEPNEAHAKFESLGENLLAIARAQSPGGKADPRLFNAAATGGSATVGADGGFLIQKDYASDLMGNGFQSGELSSRCSETEVGANSDGLEVVYLNETSRATGSRWGGVRVYRAAEAETVTDSKPQLGKWEARLEDMMGVAYATERLLQDASAMGSVFDEAFRDEFGFKLDDEIYRGTGAGQCQGVLGSAATVTVTKETSQAADTILGVNIQKMWTRVPPRSKKNGVWVTNVECSPALQSMFTPVTNVAGTENVGGWPLYVPPGGLSGQEYGTLYGRPVIEIEQASAIGDLGDIAFLDLKQYKLIRKGGVEAADSIHVRFLYNERTFRWTARVNGAPKLKAPITPYKGNATLSPFVILQAR